MSSSLFVTDHFSLSEFACKDGSPYPLEWVDDRLARLCQVLEVVRAELGGRSVHILSGYRTPLHNIQVGGAKRSQHVEGRAADITVDGIAPSEVHATILTLFAAGKLQGLGGLGIYPSWVHVDVRPWVGHLARWEGKGIGSEA